MLKSKKENRERGYEMIGFGTGYMIREDFTEKVTSEQISEGSEGYRRKKTSREQSKCKDPLGKNVRMEQRGPRENR